MIIVSIFAHQLTSFQYDKEPINEFARLFRQWQDPEFLYEFFTEHIDDLQSGFFGVVSLQTAIRETRAQARRLEREMLTLANGTTYNLDSLFLPLSDNEAYELVRSKAKGDRPKSWLRMYAIKLEPNVYIITGGAIKLTESMQEREHTRHELSKFIRCKDYLREQGIVNWKN
jgi:hypothetical protein